MLAFSSPCCVLQNRFIYTVQNRTSKQCSQHKPLSRPTFVCTETFSPAPIVPYATQRTILPAFVLSCLLWLSPAIAAENLATPLSHVLTGQVSLSKEGNQYVASVCASTDVSEAKCVNGGRAVTPFLACNLNCGVACREAIDSYSTAVPLTGDEQLLFSKQGIIECTRRCIKAPRDGSQATFEYPLPTATSSDSPSAESS